MSSGEKGMFKPIQLRIAEEWGRQIAHAISAMSGEPCEPAGKPSEAPVSAGEALWWRQPFGPGPVGVVTIAAPKDGWLKIGSHLLRAAGLEPVGEADARSTFLEILGQSLSGLAQLLGAQLGSEVVCEQGLETGLETGAAPQNFPLFRVALALAQDELPLFISVGPELCEVIAGAAGAGQGALPGGIEDAGGTPAAREGRVPNNLDLLLEVELPVSVSFGKTELALRDILKLTTGSILELDRTASAPVDILVNERLIARGDVVVVEGNYGVRIREIVSRQDRMRSLK
jgi:flagellar motor switch protein FliN/FliY